MTIRNLLNPYWWRFQWRYRRGQTPWDTQITPPEVMDFISGTMPGRALDLGCGTGTNAITLARHGWQVTGVDFVGQAIRTARKKAAAEGLAIEFIQTSVTELDMLSPPFSYILDIGCLFGLNEADRAGYGAHVLRLLDRMGWYMLYAWHPRIYKGKQVGISEAQVDDLLGGELTRTRVVVGEENNSPSAWYWYQRK
jgi:hypothetical protein